MNVKNVKIVSDYDRTVLLSNYVQVLCCDVIYVPLNYVNILAPEFYI